MLKKISLGILLGMVILIGLMTQSVGAQNLINISLTPPNIYLAIQPGEKSVQTLTLRNDSNQNLLVTPSLLGFESDNQTGRAILNEETNFKYLKFEDPEINFNQQFLLPAQSSKSIPVLVELPEQIIEAEHHLTILFTTQPENYESDSNSTVGGAIASNFLILISKNLEDRASLNINKIEAWPIIDSLMPLQYKILAENNGLNSSAASGSATVTDWQGNVVQEIKFEPDLVLAGSTRYLRPEIADPTALELGNSNNTDPQLDHNQIPFFKFKKPFLIGSYQITVNLMNNSGPNSTELTYSRTILALPFSFLLLPLLAGFIYIIYRVIILKSMAKK